MEQLRRLTMGDLPEARTLWEFCFHDSPSFTDWFFTERYRPETSLCLEIDGTIAALAHGCPMRLRVRGVAIPALMISGVATRPEYRGRGYMHRVLGGLVNLARLNGIPAVFHTPVDLAVYASLGHLPCTNALYWTAPESASPLEPAWDSLPPLSAFTACYRDATRRYSGMVLRNESDMTRKLADYRSDGGRCLTHWENGELAGYLIAQPGEAPGTWTVPEALALNPAAYQALLSRLPRGFTAKLPPDLPLPGRIAPQGVLGAADVPSLLSVLCGDEQTVFCVTDPVVPSNNGVFNGLGRPTGRAADYTLSAGALMQLLCGYGPGDARFPRQVCYCIDEY